MALTPSNPASTRARWRSITPSITRLTSPTRTRRLSPPTPSCALHRRGDSRTPQARVPEPLAHGAAQSTSAAMWNHLLFWQIIAPGGGHAAGRPWRRRSTGISNSLGACQKHPVQRSRRQTLRQRLGLVEREGRGWNAPGPLDRQPGLAAQRRQPGPCWGSMFGSTRYLKHQNRRPESLSPPSGVSSIGSRRGTNFARRIAVFRAARWFAGGATRPKNSTTCPVAV